MAYTIPDLRREGPPFAMAMLLRCIETAAAFITYGDVKSELEYQLGHDSIFPPQIGQVAGSLMDQILAFDPDAPLINALITKPSGLPGKGIEGYLRRKYPHRYGSLDWDTLAKQNKIRIIERERASVFAYPKWDEVNNRLFGQTAKRKLREAPETEADFIAKDAFGGAEESEEHRHLKQWVAVNPAAVGLSDSYGRGATEAPLLSGDKVDVLFADGSKFRPVEVKSCRSGDADLQRGLYQCVKYREVKRAEHLPYDVDVEAILVTERKLPAALRKRAAILGVAWKQVSVNQAPNKSLQPTAFGGG